MVHWKKENTRYYLSDVIIITIVTLYLFDSKSRVLFLEGRQKREEKEIIDREGIERNANWELDCSLFRIIL